MRQSISGEGLSALVAAGAAWDVRAVPGPEGHGWQLKVRYSKESQHFPLPTRISASISILGHFKSVCTKYRYKPVQR